MKVFASIFLLLIAGQVEARMYQWVNSSTGSSQLSGKPPAWYRTEDGGPRVLVFEKNKLVDDTSLKVEESQRLKLRLEAFEMSAKDQKKGLSSEEAIARLEEQIRALVESPALEAYLLTPESEEEQELVKSATNDSRPEKLVERETPDERVERLKSLISRWDERRTEEAKSVLEKPASKESKEETSSDASDNSDKAADTSAQ